MLRAEVGTSFGDGPGYPRVHIPQVNVSECLPAFHDHLEALGPLLLNALKTLQVVDGNDGRDRDAPFLHEHAGFAVENVEEQLTPVGANVGRIHGLVLRDLFIHEATPTITSQLCTYMYNSYQ